MTETMMNASGPTPPDSASLRSLIAGQFALHEVKHCPRLETEDENARLTVPKAHTLADVYKCLHQGEFGVGHNIENPQQFGNNLAFELLRAEPISGIPVLETVSLDKSVFRINLAPYRKSFDGDDSAACALLLRVCLTSASVPRGSTERFLATLDLFRDLNNAHELSVEGRIFVFETHVLDQFLSEVAHFIKSYGTVPVLSHSPKYKELNSPSYRVADFDSLKDSPLVFLVEQMQ
jgi:hypothetical protein